MKLTKLLLTGAGMVLVAAASAYAGGLADTIVETQPVVMSPDDPNGSLPSWVVPVAIVALLVGAAVVAGDDGDDGAS